VREKSVGMIKYADLVETFAGQESAHTKQIDKVTTQALAESLVAGALVLTYHTQRTPTTPPRI